MRARWLAPAAATLALALLVAGVSFELRQGKAPALDAGSGGAEVFRTSAVQVLSPVGDQRDRPAEIRWEGAPNAARYRVRIMEVDHTELWDSHTTATRIDLPPAVLRLMVPMKTLLIQVVAFDKANTKVAESETVPFRVLQKVYTP